MAGDFFSGDDGYAVGRVPLSVGLRCARGTGRLYKWLVGDQGFQVHTVCSTSSASPLTRSVTTEPPGITSEDLRIRAALHDSEKPASKIVSSHSMSSTG